jgi:PAT family beta-lactamase induction signal transducer AmpG
MTMVAGVPGMLLLHRFAPLGWREPSFTVEKLQALPPLSFGALARRGVIGTTAGIFIGAATLAILAGLRGMKAGEGGEFLWIAALGEIIQPVGIGGWMQLAGVAVFGLATGLVTAALSAAQRGGAELPVSENPE